MFNWIQCLILIGMLQYAITASPPSTPPLNPALQQQVAPGNPSPLHNANKEAIKDSTASSSNVHHQYMMPPSQQQQQQLQQVVYPQAGQYPSQVPQYLMQAPPSQNSIEDIKSDISSLRDTVMLLSNVVKQNSVAEQGAQPRTVHSYSNPPPQQNSYQHTNHQASYGSGGAHNNYDPAPIQIEVITSKKGYDEPAKVDPPKEVKKPDPPKPLSGLANLFPSLSGRTSIVASAERLFGIIKRGIKNALITGIIVAAVRLLPLLWIGLRLIFNSILPLVGVSLQGNQQYSRAFSLSADTQALLGGGTAAAATTATAAPAAREGRSSIFSPDILDEELANLEDNFGFFNSLKGKYT